MTSVDDLDDEIILCNVCNIEYDDEQRSPKLLPCLHTMCNDCALNCTRGSTLKCAICQTEHEMSSDVQFLKDSTMTNMMEMIKIQKKASNFQCSDCPDTNPGEVFCKECCLFLCKECTNAHKRTQLTRRHTILMIDDLKDAGIYSFGRKEVCLQAGHEEQLCSFYCESKECQKSVCTQCLVSDHNQTNGHIVKNLNDVCEHNKLLVKRMVGELLSKISRISSESKICEDEAKAIEDKQYDLNSQIDTLFDSLETALRNRRNQLKERVEVICQQRKNEVIQKMNTLQKNKSDMENTCNYSSRMLIFTSLSEFLQLKNVVTSKINQLISSEFEPTRSEAMELSFDTCLDQGRFQDFVQGIGEVRTNIYSADSSNCTSRNGKAEDTEQYILPYKSPPLNPPGKCMANKHPMLRTIKQNRSPIVEPLKLGNINGDVPVKVYGKGVKTPPTTENVLGRPLSLKTPVINTNRKPTSLGEFLNELQTKRKMFLKDCEEQEQESQESLDKDTDPAMPKETVSAPTTPSTVSSKRASSSPSYTQFPRAHSPVQQLITPIENETYSAKSSPKDTISTGKFGAKLSTTDGGFTTSSAFIANSTSRTSQRTLATNIGMPVTSSAETEVKNRNLKATKHEHSEPDVNNQKPRAKSQSVTWKLDEIEPKKDTQVQAKPNLPQLSESSYPDVKPSSPRKSSSDKPIVFGDISCPDFIMDPASAHHEREVSSDGRVLRNKKTDIFSAGTGIDIENSLVQYKGAIGTIPFKDQGKCYYEVDVVYNIQQPLEETWLVLEIGLCRLDDVDMHHTVERHEFARSFYIARFPEDGKLSQEFWHNRDLLTLLPLSDNSPGIEVRITYGFLVDTKYKKWIISDCNNNKVLYNFENLDFTEPLYPVFGCYNPDLCTVEMTLKTGSEITLIPQCMKTGYVS